jgi:uncharacterized protein
MDRKERSVRDFYAARARRDWPAVAEMLAADVEWHESGNEDYSGVHHGRDRVTALLKKLVEVTERTFTLEPTRFIVTAEHVATHARWSAQRTGTHVEGNDPRRLPNCG